MNKIIIYPTCASSFKRFYQSDKTLTELYLCKLSKVRPFDVTLRDGLQGLTKENQLKINHIDKLHIYFTIKYKYNPTNMEITSIVSDKIYPVFKDCHHLYNTIEAFQFEELAERHGYKYTNNYVLIPNEKQFQNIDKFIGLSNFSLITSVSESFQMKNTKMTLNESFTQIKNMTEKIKTKDDTKIRVYVSCIDECPIEGKIPVQNIVTELFVLSTLNIDKICLSDTCGTLTKETFIEIIENTKKVGIQTKKFSLHLHIKPKRENEVEEIVHAAIDYGIEEFDVSDLMTGGCSVTIDNAKLAPNMSYRQYYKFLTNYLLK